jgi:hypothetical protein
VKFIRTITLLIASFATMASLTGCGDSANLTGPEPTLDTTPPPAPSDLHFTTVSGQVVLTWTESAAPDVAGYQVYVYSANGGFVEDSDTVNADNHYQITTVPENGTAIYRVRAVDTSGNQSGFSETVQFSAGPRGNGDLTPLEVE